MSDTKPENQRVTLRKKAADEGRATKPAGAPRVTSFRERLDWKWICARIRGAGVPESDVDDVAQLVVIAMSRAEKNLELRPGQSERDGRRALLRTIIRCLVVDDRRDRACLHRVHLDLAWSADTDAATAPSPEALTLQKEQHTSLHAALDRMTHMAGVYHVLILHGLDEMPMSYVAALLGIPYVTARHWMKRAKQLLCDALTTPDARNEPGS
jgi:RNA polymerase sigma factor (sigma-70 family)